ncbi:cytochrome P450 [Actinacidiphila guanduensis]|nr:cytochrome P450 [Actinacidiphila guanduensis]
MHGGERPEDVVPPQGTRAEGRALELPGPPQPVPPWGPVPPYGTAGPEPQPDFDHADPAAYYRALRAKYGPVAPVLLHREVPAWLVLGYREVHYVAGNPELFGRDPRRWHAWDRLPPNWPLLADIAHTPSVRFTEGAEHRRRAGAIADVLAEVDQFELRQRSEQAADAAVDRFAGAGRADLMADYAEVVPLQVMAGLLGLRGHETADLVRDTAAPHAPYPGRPPAADPGPGDPDTGGHRTSATGPYGSYRPAEPAPGSRPPGAGPFAPDPDTGGHRTGGGPSAGGRPYETDAAAARVRALVQTLVDRARREPARGGPDLPALLLAHPAELTDEEIVHDLLTIFAAGRRPTADWIGNTLRLMLTDERFALTLSGGRHSVGQALNEVLWNEPPTQNIIGRWATRDTELGGRRIARGDCLVLSLAAANADPHISHGTGPGALVHNQAHLAFSHGPHRCPAPAPALAETIATAALEVLLDRLPDLALPTPAPPLPWRQSLWQRAPTTLPAVFTAP